MVEIKGVLYCEKNDIEDLYNKIYDMWKHGRVETEDDIYTLFDAMTIIGQIDDMIEE